jgi:hypothetical protein
LAKGADDILVFHSPFGLPCKPAWFPSAHNKELKTIAYNFVRCEWTFTSKGEQMEKTMDKRFSKRLRSTVKAIASALQDHGINMNGHSFGPNQYVFEEIGTVGDASGSLSISYDLHVSDEIKFIVMGALKNKKVIYDTGARYRDSYGQWFVDEMAVVMFTRDYLQAHTEIEDQEFLVELLFAEPSKEKGLIIH